MTPQVELRFPTRWTVFGPFDPETGLPRSQALTRIPEKLDLNGKTLQARRLKPKRHQLDLDTLIKDPAQRFGSSFLVFLPLASNGGVAATLGFGADYRFRAWFNGEPLFKGETIQDPVYPPAITNHKVTVVPRNGRNMLAIWFVAGRGSAVLAVGGSDAFRQGDYRSIISDVYLREKAWSRPRLKPAKAIDPVEIGSRRELFVDAFLIDRLSGGARHRLHHPVHREVVLSLNQPWEGNVEGNFLPTSVMRVDGRIRLYYKGVEMKANEPPERVHLGSKQIKSEHVCLAESDDGTHFTRPLIGRYAIRGSRRNNIVFRRGRSSHNFAPFLDENPGAVAAQRYKALAYLPERGWGHGLTAYVSPDGIRWTLRSRTPLILKGAFDSQNTAFWDGARGCYRAYHRGQAPHEPRGIMTSESFDFIRWSDPQPVVYMDNRHEHMYTNCIRPYARAPHMLIGVPARLVPARVKVPGHTDPGVSDAVLMTSRDGRIFHRWANGFIRPGPEAEVWTDRNNFPSWGMVQTAPSELSLYWCEHNGHAGLRLRRGTLRVDGFASIHAGANEVGEMLTRPFRFSGSSLEVNYATSANGALLFELCDASGTPIPNFTFADSETLFGNEIAHTVVWRGASTHVDALAGRPVRLRVRLRDADMFAIRFPA